MRVPEQRTDGTRASVYVGCGGITKPGSRVRIVDPDTRLPCPADRIGEIWVDSATKAAGYFDRPEESRAALYAEVSGEPDPRRYLRTGDLGFFAEGELFVTGRRKDVIILRGRNHYAEDLEESVRRCHPAIRPGGVAAFALDAAGEEKAAVMVEVAPFEGDDAVAADEVATAVAKAPVLERIEVLDLSLGTLGDVGGEALLNSPLVTKLKRLDLSHHYLSEAVQQRLAALPVEEIMEDEQTPDDWGDGELHRYVAVSE